MPFSSFRHFFFGPKTSPFVSQQFLACIFPYLRLVSMYRLHPSSLNNLLRSSCFNIELSLPPYVPLNFLHPFRFRRRLPPLASSPLLTFLLFQYPNLPCISSFLHASCLNIQIPPILCQVQKNVQVQKNKAPDPKTSGPRRVRKTMEFPPPPPYGGKVHEAVAGVQKKKPRSETIYLDV